MHSSVALIHLTCLLAVPSHLLGMQYDLGPKVHMTPRIMQVIADLWLNRVASYPLYVVRLVRTHIYAGYFVSDLYWNFFLYLDSTFYVLIGLIFPNLLRCSIIYMAPCSTLGRTSQPCCLAICLLLSTMVTIPATSFLQCCLDHFSATSLPAFHLVGWTSCTSVVSGLATPMLCSSGRLRGTSISASS